MDAWGGSWSTWGASWGASYGAGEGGGAPPPAPSVAVSSGVRKKPPIIRLSELSDGDRRTTAEFLKSYLKEREPFTLKPARKIKVSASRDEKKMQDDESAIIAVILGEL